MLSPEIWNFQEPESSFKIQRTDIENNLLLDKRNNFHFNHMVTVTVPDVLRIPEKLTDNFNTDCYYYRVEDLNLSQLIAKDFLTSFVKNGKLTLLSIDTRIDCDNCIAVTPPGQLTLNLSKETYQTLGLEGKVSHFQSKIKSRYIVTIDLEADFLQPGKLKYEKTKSCLQKLGNFTVILNWEPPSEDICPSSIAKHFSNAGCKIKLCTPKFESQTLYSVKVPNIDTSSDDCDVIDFAEWLGMVALQGDLTSGEAGNYITTYETPEPNKLVGQVKHLRWRGFFSSCKIKELVEELQNHVKQEGKDWAAIYVQGFSDSPISWGLEEHHYYTNGDNGYLVILNEKNTFLCTQKCSRKRYK